MTNPKTEPRTAAGRALEREIGGDYGEEIAAIEAEAAEPYRASATPKQSASVGVGYAEVPLDVDLVAQTLANLPQQPFAGGFQFRYWKIGKMAADFAAEYARLVDGAQATPQPERYTVAFGASLPRDQTGRPIRPAAHPVGSADTALLCGAGCGCRVGTEDSDRADCACDGPCCWDTWDDWIGDVLNRPAYYDEMRVARGMQSALAAQPTSAEDSE